MSLVPGTISHPPLPVAGTPTRVQIAEVVAVNADDGTIDAKPLNSRATKAHVPYPTWWIPAIGERCLLADRDGDSLQPVCIAYLSPQDGSLTGPQIRVTVTSSSLPKATTSVLGIVELSANPADPANPVAVSDQDARLPTQGENDALAGTSGAPSGTNKYVTNADSRLTDARTPTGAASGDLAGTYPGPTIATGLRSLITGALQSGAAAGGDLAGTYPNPTIATGLRSLITGALQSGAAAGGDLAGTYPSPTVKASVGLTGAPTAPTAAPGTNTTQLATTAFVVAAVPTALPPSGPAGGDLSGTYPNPSVTRGSGTIASETPSTAGVYLGTLSSTQRVVIADGSGTRSLEIDNGGGGTGGGFRFFKPGVVLATLTGDGDYTVLRDLFARNLNASGDVVAAGKVKAALFDGEASYAVQVGSRAITLPGTFDPGGTGIPFGPSALPAGQVLVSDGDGGSTWASGAAPTGAAGGDLAGTYPSPTIAAGLRSLITGAEQAANKGAASGYAPLDAGQHVPLANLSGITDTQVAAANKDGAAGTASMRTLGTGAQQAAAGNDSRITGALQSGAAAGGDLAGTYPNPTVAQTVWPRVNAYGPYASRPAASASNNGYTYLAADLIFAGGGGGLTFDAGGAGLTFGRHDGETYESDGSGWSQSSVGTGDARIPTPDQAAALAGTSGAPSGTNRYVTNSDSRLTTAAAANSAAGAILFPADGTGATFDAGGLGLTFTSQVPQGKHLASDGAGGIEFTDGPTRQEFDQLKGRVDVPQFTPLYTALPTGLPEGAVIHFLADAANGIVWQLRYSPSASPTYPWLYVGGPVLYAEVTTATTIPSNQTTYGNLTSGSGPDITLPLAGDYMVELGVDATAPNGTNVHAYMSYAIGATAAVDADAALWSNINAATPQGSFNAMRSRRKTGLSAVTLASRYRVDAAVAVNVQDRWMSVLPVRVG